MTVQDTVHHWRGTIKLTLETILALQVAISDHDNMGCCFGLPLCRHQQEWPLRCSVLFGLGEI
jgi:hypothetical protein